MFSYPVFDVDIERHVTKRRLRWPLPTDAEADTHLGGNREYSDLRGFRWNDAKQLFAFEGELIARIEAASDPEKECDAIDEELSEDDEGLFGLDLGVAATVAALSASHCIPFASCNAGTYGGHHWESHPLVVFFAREKQILLLLEAAAESGIGLENDADEGGVLAYSDDVRRLRDFAERLLVRAVQFDEIEAQA